jgi:hypothetical protein
MSSPTDPRTGREPDDPRHSNDELAGDMGVSSEREGPAGSSQQATDGVKDTSLSDEHGVPDPDKPEKTRGGEEPQPEGLTPKAGYSSIDPRSKD